MLSLEQLFKECIPTRQVEVEMERYRQNIIVQLNVNHAS